ncbi:MAG: hypothetical protein RR705_07930 [Lachnospiraceae bacterium]
MWKKYKIIFLKNGYEYSIIVEAESKSQALSWCEKSVVDNLESIHEVKN